MFYCIVTADSNELVSGDMDRFLSSIGDQDFEIVMVLREVSIEICAKYERHPRVIKVIRSAKAGISKVRNLGLTYLSSIEISSGDFVGFPDDDCSYSSDFHHRLSMVIASTAADLVVGSYGEHDIINDEVLRLDKRRAMFGASSVTAFVRWDLLSRVGGFNEYLGVGSSNFNYGEDNDFCYRMILSATSAVFAPGLRVWHLEVREVVGRNSKGYLSVSRINMDLFQLTRIFLPGIVKGPLRDLLTLDRKFSETRKIATALRRENIKLALAGKMRAVELFRV
ncbi:glycosyltransferase family 2 protein [Arthrobacter alpinus]|uniref:glycosyltransferase family 2 protein n=1 Tax=Arthrobacter alpinus TaxID=656366 RepID=UPI0012FF3FCA|nr:glycosyltransferase [Arthrobacter alpinus]